MQSVLAGNKDLWRAYLIIRDDFLLILLLFGLVLHIFWSYPSSRTLATPHSQSLLSHLYFCVRKLPLYQTGFPTKKRPSYETKPSQRSTYEGAIKTRSRSPNVDSVRGSPERILRGSRILLNIIDQIQDLKMESYPAAFCVTSLWQNPSVQTPHEVRINISEVDEIEGEP